MSFGNSDHEKQHNFLSYAGILQANARIIVLTWYQSPILASTILGVSRQFLPGVPRNALFNLVKYLKSRGHFNFCLDTSTLHMYTNLLAPYWSLVQSSEF